MGLAGKNTEVKFEAIFAALIRGIHFSVKIFRPKYHYVVQV